MVAFAAANIRLMKTVGYVRVSTDRQAEHGVSLEAQEAKIRAMAIVHGTELSEVIVDGGESAKSLNRPGIARLLAMVDTGGVKVVIIAKLDRLTRSVKDLCGLLELFEKRKVTLISVAESLDTGSASTAFRTQPPNLQPVPLMDMDFTVTCPLIRHRMPQIRFLYIGSYVCSMLLSDPASRRRPCASLSLHLHQVVKRTFTFELSNMLGTQAARRLSFALGDHVGGRAIG